MGKTIEGLLQDVNAASDFSEKIYLDALDGEKSLSQGGWWWWWWWECTQGGKKKVQTKHRRRFIFTHTHTQRLAGAPRVVALIPSPNHREWTTAKTRPPGWLTGSSAVANRLYRKIPKTWDLQSAENRVSGNGNWSRNRLLKTLANRRRKPTRSSDSPLRSSVQVICQRDSHLNIHRVIGTCRSYCIQEKNQKFKILLVNFGLLACS